MTNDKIRLQKFLAQCGVASRRKAEELILAGAVKVNGKKADLGDKIDPTYDKILYKGKRVTQKERHVYIALYKPRGYLSAVSDERGSKCVTDLLKGIKKRLYPVGRLDKNSEGLLLMTNDGDFANKLMHPSNHIPKTYLVTVAGSVSMEQLSILNSEMNIDGKNTIPAKVSVVSERDDRTVLQIVLYQGINRQIRKMCEKVGLIVKRLKRISEGNITLVGLRPGSYRFLEQEEVQKLLKEQDDVKS